MRAVVQRVKRAAVRVNKKEIASINKGILALIGIAHDDGESDVKYMTNKLLNLRIFEDEKGRMNLSCLDIKGEILLVSQFTLYGDARKGRRPDFTMAAPFAKAQKLFDQLVTEVKKSGLKVETGAFGQKMEVELVNDGPVTILLDSKRVF